MSGSTVDDRDGRQQWSLAAALIAGSVVAIGGLGFTQMQAQSGERLYAHHCARCHGPNGEGKDDSYKGLRAPELIGPTALPCMPRPFQKLRLHAFRTVEDVYAFVSTTMPADQPASLDAAQYWNVIAYLLKANGKTPDNARINAATSAQIVLHANCTASTPKAQP